MPDQRGFMDQSEWSLETPLWPLCDMYSPCGPMKSQTEIIHCWGVIIRQDRILLIESFLHSGGVLRAAARLALQLPASTRALPCFAQEAVAIQRQTAREPV